jgi:hypothetical protein
LSEFQSFRFFGKAGEGKGSVAELEGGALDLLGKLD